MILKSLTNIINNGSFEANINSWSGGSSTRQGGSAVNQNAVTPTRVNILAPSHGEFGTSSIEVGNKVQGAVYVIYGSAYNTPTSISVTPGHQYYIRCQVRLRGSTAGVASVCTLTNNFIPTTQPELQVAFPPLSPGLQSTNTAAWELIDSIWICPNGVTTLSPKIYWQTTANQGNNDVFGQLDNIMIIDLTANSAEMPLLAIRHAVNNYTQKGYWDGSVNVNVPEPPVLYTDTISGITDRTLSFQVNFSGGTAPLQFFLDGLPVGHGLSIDSNGLILGTLRLLEGSYSPKVHLIDNFGFSIEETFTLNVGTAPSINDEFIPGSQYDIPFSWTPNITGSQPISIQAQVISGVLPSGLSLNPTTGAITGTPTIDGQECVIRIVATNLYDTVTKNFTFGVYSAPNIGTQSPLRNAVLNQNYSQTIQVSGVTPMEFEILQSNLPNGLSLHPDTGLITGIPTLVGNYSFTIRVTNALGSATRLYTLAVLETPNITTTQLGYARLNTPYSAQLLATGSTPITWYVSSGSLPNGLTLNPNTGVISGTPTQTGTFNFQIYAQNSVGDSYKNLSIEAGLALGIITTSPIRSGIINTTYANFQFEAAGVDSSYPVTWALSGGTGLPQGMSFNTTTGVLSGTPSQGGTFNFNITVTNGSVNSQSNFVLFIGTPPTITTSSLTSGKVEVPYYSATIQATGTAPFNWSLSGNVPQGMTINSSGIIIWINPTEGIITGIIVNATNDYGSNSRSYNLEITTPSIKTPTPLPNAPVNEFYEVIFESGGGAKPHTWTFISGTLPNGLYFSENSHTLSGIPTQIGLFSFTIRVTNNVGGFDTVTFQLTVGIKPTITTGSISGGLVNVSFSKQIDSTGTSPINFTLIDGSLPQGLGLSATGVISGTPTQTGTFTITIRATNIIGTDEKTYSFVFLNAFGITTGSLPIGVVNNVYPNIQLLTAGGTGGTTLWNLSYGSIPNGLNLSNTGVISGTPTQGGTFNFEIHATDGTYDDYKQFSILVGVSPKITNYSMPDGVIEEEYSFTFQASGDTPITWSFAGNLPEGFSLNSSTGEIYGFTIQDGIFSGLIVARNQFGYDSVSISFNIKAEKLKIHTLYEGSLIRNLIYEGDEVYACCFENEILYLKSAYGIINE